MAIYHLHASVVSRNKGGRSCATASYITGKKIYDERHHRTYEYGRKQRVIATDVILPKGAPEEWYDPEKLFNAIELHETKGNAQTARKIEVALPVELSWDLDLEIDLVRKFILDNLTCDGYAATWAIHHDADGKNPHAHILIPARTIDPETGAWQPKQRREYVLDENGHRVPQLDRNGNQKVGKKGDRQWKTKSIKLASLEKKEKLLEIRTAWAEVTNAYLELMGKDARIDERSFKDRGIDDEPTIHEGYQERRKAAKGEPAPRIAKNKAIMAARKQLVQLRMQWLILREELRSVIAERNADLRQAKERRERERYRLERESRGREESPREQEDYGREREMDQRRGAAPQLARGIDRDDDLEL